MTTPHTLATLAGRLTYLISLVPGLGYQEVDTLAELKSRGHTGQIARGGRERPAAETIVNLARVLGTSAEWLVNGGKDAAPSGRRVRRAVTLARAARTAKGRTGSGARRPTSTTGRAR